MAESAQYELLRGVQNRANWNRSLLTKIKFNIKNDDSFLPRLKHTIKDPETLKDLFDEMGMDVGTSKHNANNGKRPRLICLEDIAEAEPEWIVPGYIVRGAINVIGADGGTGKTTIECALAAAVSSGANSFLCEVPFKNEPERVLFLAAEESFENVLKGRLRQNGANMRMISTLDIADDSFTSVKITAPVFREIIEELKPALVIIDPLQAFIPPEVQMGQRNAMRNCMQNLVSYGMKYGTSFLIAVHCNKQAGSYGRKRISDSSDIWDIARSVLMMGETGDGDIRYLSHEKCNVAERSTTVLLSLEDGKVIRRGTTDWRDREFVMSAVHTTKAAPAKEEAKKIICDILQGNNGKMKSSDLDELARKRGVSGGTLKRAKSELNDEKRIRYRKDAFDSACWYTELVN